MASALNNSQRRVVGVVPVLAGVVMSSEPELWGRAYLVHHVFYKRDGELISYSTNVGGMPPASKASIIALKEVDNVRECVIRLEAVESSGKEMPCEHQFHGECVVKWLQSHGSCPLYRYQMPAASTEEEEEGEADGDRAARRGRCVVLSVLVIGPSRIIEEEAGREPPIVIIDDLD